MARLAMEKYLVLWVDDVAGDSLSIRLPGPHAEELGFLGSISDGHELIALLQQSGDADEQVRLPLADLLAIGLMLPREEGVGMVQWLQSQPFEGVTVVVLDGRGALLELQSAA